MTQQEINKPEFCKNCLTSPCNCDEIECPFCRENGFDKIGLKQHLKKYCIEFAQTESI